MNFRVMFHLATAAFRWVFPITVAESTDGASHQPSPVDPAKVSHFVDGDVKDLVGLQPKIVRVFSSAVGSGATETPWLK